MNFIGAVWLMNILMQKVGVPLFPVEGGVADGCLKQSQNKMTQASPLDVARQCLAHTANERSIAGPVTSRCAS